MAPLWARDGLRVVPVRARRALGPAPGSGRVDAPLGATPAPRGGRAGGSLLLLLLPPRAGPSARELDAILARVAVMVSAATDMFPAKARETLAAHPELLAALARGDFDFDCDGVAETLLDEQPARDSDSSSSASDSDSSSSDASVHVALGALVDRHVAASLAFLGDEAGVPPAALGALVASHPTVLSASVPERLRPAWAFLRRPANRGGCGLSPREAVDAAANDPTMLTRDVATSLEPALAVLVEDVGVRPRDAAGMGMLRRATSPNARRARLRFSPSSAGSDPSPPKRSRGGTRGWC